MFRPDASATADREVPPEPPIPPDCRRLVRVGAVGGDVSIVFTGPPQADRWRTFYDRWAAESGLQTARGWQESSGVWHIAYESNAPSMPTVIRIHLDATETGPRRGVIFSGPR